MKICQQEYKPLSEGEVLYVVGEGEDGGALLAGLLVVEGRRDGGGHLAAGHGTGEVGAVVAEALAGSAAAPFPT